MLVYLNSNTWTHNPEGLTADIHEAFRLGVHLQPCHEFPSVLDPGSPRAALEFKSIMDATPSHLKKSPTNVYSQIAIGLKGGELREVGLAILAGRLVKHMPRVPIRMPSAPAASLPPAETEMSATVPPQDAHPIEVHAVHADADRSAGAIPVSAESSV